MNKHINFIILSALVLSCNVDTGSSPNDRSDVAEEIRSAIGDAYKGPIIILDDV